MVQGIYPHGLVWYSTSILGSWKFLEFPLTLVHLRIEIYGFGVLDFEGSIAMAVPGLQGEDGEVSPAFGRSRAVGNLRPHRDATQLGIVEWGYNGAMMGVYHVKTIW